MTMSEIREKYDNEQQTSFSPSGVGGPVLVTGGTGFLGAYIIKELIEKGYAVKAIRRSDKLPFFIDKNIFDKVQWVDGDVLDVIALEEAMEGVDAVIHSAAIISFYKKERAAMMNVNIDGTANVVNVALDKKVKRFVHISSVAALGRTTSGETVNEEKKWQESKINTHYGISKYKAELEVWRGFAEGLTGVIINPSTILGYGDWNTSSCRIFKNVYDEFPWYTTGINGFVDVEDAAKAVVQLMASGINEERFIVSGESMSFQHLFNTIADGFGKKYPHKEATAFMGQLAWRLEKIKTSFTGKLPLLTKETAAIAQSKTYFDNSKILKVLPGFSFTPLQETINKACKKYAEHNK
jgi:dihydroflavonol-4-reductase